MHKQKLLVIYLAEPKLNPQRTFHHLHVFDYLNDEYDVTYFNAKGWWGFEADKVEFDSLVKNEFNIVVLHHTFLIRRQTLNFYPLLKKIAWLSDSKALKIAIPQDEGTCSHVLDEILYVLGIDIILSTHYTEASPLYPLCRNHALIQRCLPGYVEPSILPGIKIRISNRTTDIFYRARSEPLYYGESLYLKGKIADVFRDKAGKRGFNIDISTRIEDRMNGPEWFDALRTTKMVLGSYAGYNTINCYGERIAQFEYISSNGDVTDNDHVLSFLDQNEWNNCVLHSIAPRHFEAIQAGTCQLLIEDEYRGVLKPDVHYISVKKDFSNLDEILDKAQDINYLQKIADQAYQDIILSNNYSIEVFAQLIKDTIIAYPDWAKSNQFVSKKEKLNRLYIKTLKHKSIYEHRAKLIETISTYEHKNSQLAILSQKLSSTVKQDILETIMTAIKRHPRLFKCTKNIMNFVRRLRK